MTALRNVYACLIHERQECALDLVRNLSCMDPESLILVYNGGNSSSLTSGFPFERYGAVLHPSPRAMAWGKLHDFALDCMRFALENYPFEFLTIVDSDQLAVRPGYSEFLSQFLAQRTKIGWLGNSPQVQPPDTKIGPAAAAFRELNRWRGFLRQFPDGERKYPHWTFWPSTVFTVAAAKDLVDLYDRDRQLKSLMDSTKIWATEEVLLPTLVSLLGYEGVQNPCSYDFVKYREPYRLPQLKRAMQRRDVFWIHPVPRKYDDPLRQHIRTTFGQYRRPVPDTDAGKRSDDKDARLLLSLPILNRMKKVDGWLAEEEADLLIGATMSALRELPEDHAIVEIGSYCGRSTVVFGSVVKSLGLKSMVYAIDPHDGTVGARDQGVKSGPPTLQRFKRNIAQAGLNDIVKPIKQYSYAVKWTQAIGLLFVDGLHDYYNVARDFLHFEEWVASGGYIAFHDYADYYPGVKAFVDELLESGKYQRIRLVGSLMLVKKLQPPQHGVKTKQHRPWTSAAHAEEQRAIAVRSAQHMLGDKGRPMVSCIMPTHNRRLFAPKAIEYFLRQNYPFRELIVVDDGSDAIGDLIPEDERIRYVRLEGKQSVGAKRNLACEAGRGEIVIHWDDDDWMARGRIDYQVNALLKADAEVSGLPDLLFYEPRAGRAWRYEYPKKGTQLVAGGTLCYTKRFWRRNPFAEVDLGEDARFVWNRPDKRITTLDDLSFYVAITHPENTNLRKTTGKGWSPYSTDTVRGLIGEDLPFYERLASQVNGKAYGNGLSRISARIRPTSRPSGPPPLISCIMPTRNRRAFVTRSIEYFHRQDLPDKELIIVDDGEEDLTDLVAGDACINYVRTARRASVGAKRNIAVQRAKGSIIAHWDDDDWYANDRLGYQLDALLKNDADICGMVAGFFFDVPSQEFWTCTPALHAKLFFANVHGRSIMYAREVWESCGSYPDTRLGEDAAFLRKALDAKRSMVRLPNKGRMIYIRHGANAWAFHCGRYGGADGWRRVSAPSFMPQDDLQRYLPSSTVACADLHRSDTEPKESAFIQQGQTPAGKTATHAAT